MAKGFQKAEKKSATELKENDLSRKVIGINQPAEPEGYLYLKFEATKKNKERYGRNPFIFKCIEQIIEKGKLRTIALVDGEQTIYVDEMSEQGKKVMDRKSGISASTLKFFSGALYVGKNELLVLEFLNKSNHNLSNTERDNTKAGLFQLNAPEKAAQESVDTDRILTNAKSYIYETMETTEGQDTMVRYAEVLGIGTSGRTLGQIQFDLIARATGNPKQFMDGLNDKNTKNKSIVLEAIKAGVLKKDNNRLLWADSNTDLVVSPVNFDPVDFFVSKTFKGGDFADTLLQIESMVMQTAPVV